MSSVQTPVAPTFGGSARSIVGDAVHNLRAALDFVAAEILKNEPDADRADSYFPIGNSRQNLITCRSYRLIQRAAPDLALVIADIIKPYKAGGEARFIALNQLDRMDKHRVFVPSVVMSNYITVAIHEDQEENPPPVAPGTILTILGITAGDGTVISHARQVRPGTAAYLHNQRNGYPTVQILFGKGEVFEDQPIIPTLRELAQLVDGVIDALEAHCE